MFVLCRYIGKGQQWNGNYIFIYNEYYMSNIMNYIYVICTMKFLKKKETEMKNSLGRLNKNLETTEKKG